MLDGLKLVALKMTSNAVFSKPHFGVRKDKSIHGEKARKHSSYQNSLETYSPVQWENLKFDRK